jgi:hypothetical protein
VYRTDRLGYSEADSGCEAATDFLGGKQSHCLTCPFESCVFDGEHEYVSTRLAKHKLSTEEVEKRSQEILKDYENGLSIKQLMVKYSMADSSIRAAKKRARELRNGDISSNQPISINGERGARNEIGIKEVLSEIQKVLV